MELSALNTGIQIVLFAVLFLASLFLLFKTIKNSSFIFVRNQCLLCLVYSASDIFLILIGDFFGNPKGYLVFLEYLLSFAGTTSVFLIYWNISLQYLVTSRQLERLFQHSEDTEHSQAVIDEMQSHNLYYKKYDKKMQVLITAIVFAANLFAWLASQQITWFWFSIAIFSSLIEVVLSFGIIYMLFVALLTIKRANQKYFQSAETRTISINLAMAVLACFSFFTLTIVDIFFVLLESLNIDQKRIKNIFLATGFFETASGCIALYVILWIYYSFVVRPVQQLKSSQLLQEDSFMEVDEVSDGETQEDATENFAYIENDVDLNEEEKRFQRTILITLMQADGKVRKPYFIRRSTKEDPKSLAKSSYETEWN